MRLIIQDGNCSKEAQTELTESIVKNVEEGIESALIVSARIKFISEALEAAKKKIQPIVVDEIEQYHKNEAVTVLGGYKVELKEMGVKYNYSECNHIGWNELTRQIEDLTAQRKAIEEQLKTIKKAQTFVDEETGEAYTVYPPQKQSSTTPVFSFIKSK